MKEIFGEDYRGFNKFRQRLLENIVMRTSYLLFPTPSHSFLVIIENLGKLNCIYIDSRKSLAFVDLYHAIYLSRAKSPYKAAEILQALKTELSPEDHYLGLLYKYAAGINKLSLNQTDDALVELIRLVSTLQQQDAEEKSRTKRRYLIILYSSIYWAAAAYNQKRWFSDCVKYCKLGTDMFETDLPDHSQDLEFISYYEKMAELAQEARQAISRQFRIERKLREIDAVVPANLRPSKNSDYKQLGFFRLKSSRWGEASEQSQPQSSKKSPIQQDVVVDRRVGITLRNSEGYAFYNVGPVKFLDEFSPEDDKTDRGIRSLGKKSLAGTKLSPYKIKSASIFEKSKSKTFKASDSQLQSVQSPKASSQLFNRINSTRSALPTKRELDTELGPRKKLGILQDLKRINENLEQI